MNNSIKQTIENLERNGFNVKYFETSDEAVNELLNSVDPKETVGIGGTITVLEMGIYEKLIEKGNAVFWHWKAPEDKKNTLKKAATADIYLSSTNALTEDGRIINIDGTGNRLSGILYGHEKVIIVAGRNKISRNYEEAMIRIKNVACPQNAERLNRNTPCRVQGKCMDCNSKDRMCMATLTLDRQPAGVPITIYLINEELGY